MKFYSRRNIESKTKYKLIKVKCIENKLTKYKKYPPKPILSIKISSKIVRKLWSKNKHINHICVPNLKLRIASVSE